MLEELGYVEVRKTRQGSKISREGEAFQTMLKERLIRENLK